MASGADAGEHATAMRNDDDEPQARQREQVEAQVDAVLRVGLADRCRRASTAGSVCHCCDAAAPANRPSTAGPTIMTSRRSGSIASRYWSRFACSCVDGAYTGRDR